MPSRIDFTNVAEILPINRLAPSPSPFVEITERVWMLNFENCQHPPETIFDIDGLGLHISKQTQAELKGATILVVSDTIVVEYWHS